MYNVHIGISVHPLGKRFDRLDCVHIQRRRHNIVNHRILSKGCQVVLLSVRRRIRLNEIDEKHICKHFDIGNGIQLYNNNNNIRRYLGISFYFKGISKNKKVNRLTLIFLFTYMYIFKPLSSKYIIASTK